MANEVSLFQQAVPDYAKEAQLDDMTKALGGNTGLKRISIRGKFRSINQIPPVRLCNNNGGQDGDRS